MWFEKNLRAVVIDYKDKQNPVSGKLVFGVFADNSYQ